MIRSALSAPVEGPGSDTLADRGGQAPPPGVEVSPPQRELDPRVKLGLLLCGGILAFVLERPSSLLLLFFVSLTATLYAGVTTRHWRWLGWTLGVAAWSLLLSQGLFYGAYPRTPVATLLPPELIPWDSRGLVLYREGLVHGAVQSLRLSAMALCGLALTTSTPAHHLLRALVQLKVPYALAFLTGVALQLLPVLVQSWQQVRRSLALRRPPGGAGLRGWGAGGWGASLRPVLVHSLRASSQLAMSLATRAFRPDGQRTWLHPPAPPGRQWLLLGAAASLTLACVGLRLLFILYSNGIYYQPLLRPLYAWVRMWM